MFKTKHKNIPTSKTESPEAINKNGTGHVDSICSGFVTGWAIDHESNTTNTVGLFIDGELICGTKANVYRKDLKDAELSDGFSGFQIPVVDILKTHIGKKISIKINNKDIKTKDLFLSEPDGKFWFGFEKLQNQTIIGTIVSEKFNGEKTIIIRDGEKIISSLSVMLSQGHNHISIPLPINIFDDDYHLLSVGVKNYPFSLWTDNKKLVGILTPWEYLKGSFKEPGFMGLSSQSKYRYESLRLQLEAVHMGELPGVDAKDIFTCHDAIVKGWEGNNQFTPFRLPQFTQPKVTIIIPAYNKLELTYHAIASILLSYNKTSYEVIVADDSSTDNTSAIDKLITNVIHIRNSSNMRFLKSCNNAAKHAKGQYIVFLNNDTETTSFWLDELIYPFENDSEVGLTGSKLLNTDGSLQEAGGIVWSSGQPWNVGNGANPISPEYNYTRQTDYLTGAAMCIKKSLWNLIDGFSEEYAPCYYEDTDLAFKVRDAGFKTIYTPLSQVVHFEGQSHGKDLSKGLKKYQLINESTFRSKWFKHYRHNGSEGIDLNLQKDRGIDHRVLVIDYATPDQHSDAGSYAAIQEMKLLQKMGMKLTFVPENMAHMGKLSRVLQRMGVEVLYAPFYSSVFDVIERRINEFDAIYITRYTVAEKYIEQIRARTKAKIIFNNADLHFLREIRAANSTGEYTIKHAIDTRNRELDVMRKVDAILSYNETEHAVIQSHNMRMDNIFRCPWVLSKKGKGKEFESREGIAFLGGFRHHPNVQAVKWFAQYVMPELISRQPDIKFYIYGSNPTNDIEALASKNIIVKGFTENLDDIFFNHRVIVAPLLSGAGIKGKVLEAMSYGIPQVLTNIAAESTGLSHKISAWIQDDNKLMSDGIINIYNDKSLWEKFSENSLILANELYSEKNGLMMMSKAFEFVKIFTAR